MRELVLHIPVDSLKSFGFSQFIDTCCRANARRLELLSCQKYEQGWLVKTNLPLEESEIEDDCVNDVKLLSGGDGTYEYLIVVDQSEPPVLAAGCSSEVICEAEIIPDRDLTRSVIVAPEHVIKQINEGLVNANISCELIRIREYQPEDELPDSLTTRQRELITLAYDRGYYEVPRSVDLNDLATLSDLDKSTVSEHLRRAEQSILEGVLAQRQ